MDSAKKIEILKDLLNENSDRESIYYTALEEMGDLKSNYYDYMTTEPISLDKELLRIPVADYELCAALLTAILREDCKCCGTLIRRINNGQVSMLLNKMIELLIKM